MLRARCVWQVDMYFLKQRPDFQKKFNLPAESEQDNEEMDDSRPWRRKQQAQLDAEVAERSAQLAAAAAGIRSSATLQQHPPAQQPGPAAAAPEPDKQQPAKSWWSVKLNWRQ
jgi:hypothetical protein